MRYGVIGGGGMACVHAGHILRMPDTQLIACAAPEFSPAMRALADNAQVACTTDITALLRRDDVDAIVVATPTDTHALLTIAALQAGHHVLVEKPLARTVSEGIAMLEAAQHAQRKLLCGQVVRYFPEYATAHDTIVTGTVGQIGVARTSRAGTHPPAHSWYADTPRSGGVALDLLIHDIDWLLWTFGQVERVYARSITARAIPGRDGVLAILRFASGVIAHAEANWSYPEGFVTSLEVAGSDGIVAHRNDGIVDLVLRPQPGSGAALAADSTAQEDPYYAQLCAFDAWIRGGAAPRSSPQDSLESLRITLAIVESATTGAVLSYPVEGMK